MEMTREKVKDWLSRTKRGGLFGSNIVSDLCTALLAEMDKPKVWDGAPYDCTHCQVNFIRHMRAIHSVVYERELPKSRERQIAEEYAKMAVIHGDELSDSYITEYIEAAILKAKSEWTAGK
jgi:23S rRNA maturation-related 3'-5' exoribonuclease YhaM